VAKSQRRRAPGQEATAARPSNLYIPASITLHEGDFASGGVVVVTVPRTHFVDSDLRFEIVERPAAGVVRILQQHADVAERWLTQHRYSNVRLEDVTEDEAGVDVVEGRAV
jgi:hypothetical protein